MYITRPLRIVELSGILPKSERKAIVSIVIKQFLNCKSIVLEKCLKREFEAIPDVIP